MIILPNSLNPDYLSALIFAKNYIRSIKIDPQNTCKISHDPESYEVFREFVSQYDHTQFYLIYEAFNHKGKYLIRNMELYDQNEFRFTFPKAETIIATHHGLNFNHYPTYDIQNLTNLEYSVHNLTSLDNVQIIYRRVVDMYNREN